MKEGTISVLFGIHSLTHAFAVAVAWRKTYGKWPELWEGVCILLHDIGHWGTDYLSDPGVKSSHWELGARVARHLFGEKGYALVAGHCPSYSGGSPSKLYLPDKVSWSLLPLPVLCWHGLVEPKIRGGQPVLRHAREFRKRVKENLESGNPTETHEMWKHWQKERGEGKRK